MFSTKLNWFSSITRLSVVALLCLTTLLPAQEMSMVQEVPVPLTISSPSGQGVIVVTARVNDMMELQDVEAAPVLNAITAPIIETIRETLTSSGEDGWLDGAELGEVGFDLAFDAANLAVTLNIPLDALGTQTLEVYRNRQLSPWPEAPNATIALGVPVWLQAGQTIPREGEPATTLELLVAPGLSLRTWVLESEARILRTDEETTAEIDNTRLVKVWTPSMVRLQAGQVVQFAQGLQATERLLGASLDNLDADVGRFFVPAVLERPLTVEVPGSLDVFVNGRRSRSFPVQPGRYLVADVPISPGINTIWVEYTGSDGTTERFDLIVPHAGGLLDQGRIQYAISAGVEEEAMDRAGGAGFLRYGVLPRLTTGVLADISSRGMQGGLEAETAFLFGELSTTGYISRDTTGSSGWAVEGAYRFHLLGRRALPVISTSVQYQNPQFIRPAPESSSATQEFQVNSTISQSLPGNVGLVISHVYRTYHETVDPGSLLYLGASRNIGERFALRLSAFAETDNPENWGATFTFTARGLNRKLSGSAAYDVKDNELDLSGSGAYSGPVLVSGTAALRRISMEEGTLGGGNGTVRADHPRLEGSGNLSFAMSPDSPLADQQVDSLSYSGRVGTGFYLADRLFGVGTPHRSAFALVRPAASLPTDRVYIRQSAAGGPLRQSGILGAAMTGPYEAGTQTTIVTEVPEVPADYSLGPTEFALTPGYRSGTPITISFLRYLYVRGRLTDDTGEALAYTVLQVRPTFSLPPEYSGAEAKPLGDTAFTDETGNFDIYGLIPGTYEATVADGTDRTFTFTVPDNLNPLVEVGEIVVASPLRKE